MKILHVDKFLPPRGGVGSVVRLLSRLQRERGHEVARFGCVDNAGDRQMPALRDFTSSRSAADLALMIHNNEAAAKLAAFLRQRDFDVAHLHNIYHHLTPSILPVLARRGLGVVMTLHDYRLACPAKHFFRSDGPCMRCQPNKFYHAAGPKCEGLAGLALAFESFVQRFFRRYISRIDLFICPGNFMRDVLVGMRVPAAKVVVIRNAVSRPAMPAGDDGGREVLYVGRLSPEKGPELMLDLAERLPDAAVVIAGGGPMAGSIAQETEQRGLANVTLAGHVPHEKLGQYLARAAAVVLSSRCLENSPMAMLEAMACGVCVVVPDQVPLREWVRDRHTGRLYAAGRSESLARVVGEVLDDAASRRRMGAAAAKLIAERHDAQAIVERTDNLYAEAIRRCALRW